MNTATAKQFTNQLSVSFLKIFVFLILGTVLLVISYEVLTESHDEQNPQQELVVETEAPSISELVSNYFEFKEQMEAGGNISPVEMENLEFLVDSFRDTALNTIMIHQLNLSDRIMTEEDRVAVTEFLTSLKTSE